MKIKFFEVPAPWLVRPNVQTPLGPLYLATVLSKKGYDVTVDILKDVESLKEYTDTDVFAFSGTTLEYPMVELCAKCIRKEFPNAIIIYGGIHATAMIDELKDSDLFDSIGIRECENTILDMIKDIENGVLKKVYEAMEYISDINTIPFPDRTLVRGQHGGNVFAFDKNYIGSGHENFLTSRGCPFSCYFCASEHMWNRKVRFRSVKNIKDEIEYIIQTTGIHQLRIADDNITSNEARCTTLCKEIREYNLAWRCSVRAESLTPDMAEVLAEAGCKEVSVGVESGDQRVLDFLNKRTTIEKMANGIQNAHDAGMVVRALMMIGTPGEFPDTPEISMEYLESLPVDIITLAKFIPLPGTDVWWHPEKYECEILSKDFRKYNKDFWVSLNQHKVYNGYNPLIHNKKMTLEQQIDNVSRMTQYVAKSGKGNRG